MAGFRLATDVRPTRYALRFELDLERWCFRGHERCELVLERPRREIVLHALDLEVSGAVVMTAGRSLQPRVDPDQETETIRLSFEEELPAGPCVLELEVGGEIRADLKALYRSTRGTERYAITTLWPAESRRLYACFDEPPFKARFGLELVIAPELNAIANARLIERVATNDGLSLWRFAETPPLSPYLLAFAVGPFDGTDVDTTASGTPVRVWVPRGLAPRAIYARDAHRDSIDRLEEYTGIPYPYDKVEGVGVVDFPAGAMENPGAVTYRLELVTADPASASARALKSTVHVVAHELTHMWWGDLVTLAWWDDLWLSESFATFIGGKVTDALHPEWGEWRDFVAGATRGFALDGLASTHAIHAPAESAAAALERVDAITYQKGAAVLRMLEGYLGEEAFRAGVRIYLERFRESTATAAHFWKALDEASGEDVSRIAKAWITEPGHPIIHVRREDRRLALRQRRFFLDPAAADTGQRWPVPLVLRSATGETRALLDGERGSVDAPNGWIFPNARAAGFYRFALDGPLRKEILSKVSELTPEERLLFLDNEWALLQSGDLPASDYVAVVRSFAGDRDRAVLAVAFEQLQWLAVHAAHGAAQHTLADLTAIMFGPVLEGLGLDPVAGELEDDQELRAIAIRAMGDLAGSPEVRREAASRILAHLDGRTQDRNLIGVLARVAAIDGDADLHRRFVDRIREGDPQEVERFRNALPVFRDVAATRETVARIDDRTVRDQDLPGVFYTGLRNVAQRRTYWDAFLERYASRVAPLEGMVRGGILQSLGQLTPPELAAKADAFLSKVDAPDTREIVPRIRETLRLQSAAAQRIARELADETLSSS